MSDGSPEIKKPNPSEERDLERGGLLRREIVGEIKRELSVFSGPLPPPEALAEYEKVFPGCAERIVSMAERQSDHRQSLERRVVYSNTRNETVGQIIAGILSFVAIVGGIYLLANDKSASGFGLILIDAAALVGAFAFSRSQQGKERREKKDLIKHSVEEGRESASPKDT